MGRGQIMPRSRGDVPVGQNPMAQSPALLNSSMPSCRVLDFPFQKPGAARKDV